MSSITENPVSLTGKPSVDLEAARGSRIDGTLTAEQAIVLMEEQMQAKIAELEARIGAAGAPVDAAVRKIFARFTEAPPNMHQALVHWAAEEEGDDEDAASRWLGLCASVCMVLGQCMVVAGVFYGTVLPSCSSSDQCGAGTYCTVGGSARCNFCGSAAPLLGQTDPAGGGTLNVPDAEDFAGFNTTLVAEVCASPTERLRADGFLLPTTAVASWCETCVFTIDGTVDPLTNDRLVAGNVGAMGPFDDAAMIFATVVIALTIVAELNDITMCTLAIRHAGDNLSPGWRFILTLLGGMRRWIFLPTLVAAVPILVLFKGGGELHLIKNDEI